MMPSSQESKLVDFSYCLTSDLDMNIRIKVSSLEGVRKAAHRNVSDVSGRANDLADMYLTCRVFAYNRPLCTEVQTAFHSLGDDWASWNEWIVLPVKYKHVPIGAQITLTVWEASGPRSCSPVGGCTMPLFGNSNTLLTGEHKLYMWPGREADGSTPTLTPSKIRDYTEVDRLERLMRLHERGDITQVDWLDHLVYREVERINNDEKKKGDGRLYLYVYLPKFDFPLVFHEAPYRLAHERTPGRRVASNGNGLNGSQSVSSWVSDPEAFQENPVEEKHRKLTRSQRSAPFDVNVKPNSNIRDELKIIVGYPPTKILTNEEKDLLWKFRYYLTRDKKALTKFLRCVTWNDTMEVSQARDLLNQWTDIDVADALELLGPSYEDPEVRRYAVKQLMKADDDELLTYLLQLVQALKFDVRKGDGRAVKFVKDTQLLEFLVTRALKNTVLGNYFYWYISVEEMEPSSKELYTQVKEKYLSMLLNTPGGYRVRKDFDRQELLVQKLLKICNDLKNSKESRLKKIEILRSYLADPENELETFDSMSLPLDSSVKIVGIVAEKANVFKSSLQPLYIVFKCEDGSSYPIIFKSGDDMRQDQLVVQLISLMDKLLKHENLDLKLTEYNVLATGPAHGMVQFVKSESLAAIIAKHGSILTYLRLISTSGYQQQLQQLQQQQQSQQQQEHLQHQQSSSFQNTESMIDLTPDNIDESSSSSLVPDSVDNSSIVHPNGQVSGLDDQRASGSETTGDASNGITSRLPVNSDMSMSTSEYDMSYSAISGLVVNGSTGGQQWVPGVNNSILDAYIRSLAGYCVITNLFGVGDRHLDNILLTPQGNLFHIDFGFILGRDPKPFPPPIKLSKEMVDAMGGNMSRGYLQFISYACTAFSSLRKSANLVLNLLSLMVEAPLPDIAIEPDKVVNKVQEKYRLDLRDEEAMNYFETAVIQESLAAVLPQVMEKIHQVAQLLRS